MVPNKLHVGRKHLIRSFQAEVGHDGSTLRTFEIKKENLR